MARLPAVLLAALAARRDALVSRDAETLRALLHPDFVYTNATGSVLDVEGYLDLTVRGPLHWRDQTLTGPRLSVVGATLVLVATVVDRLQVNGEEHVWTFATTQVYVDSGGALSYLAGHTGPLED